MRATVRILALLIGLVTIFYFQSKTAAAYKENIVAEIKINERTELRYSKDEEGNVLGACDFYVCGNTVYILSSSSNTILSFVRNDHSDTLNLSDYGITGVQIAANNKLLFTLDSQMRISTFKSGKLIGQFDIMEICCSEAVNELYYYNNKLFMSVEDPVRMCGITYCFHVSEEGDISFLWETDHSMIEGRDSSIVYKTVDKNITYIDGTGEISGFSTSLNENVIGLRYMGSTAGGQYRLHSYEIEERDGREYLIEKVYYFNESGEVAKELIIPRQENSIVSQVKTIDGTLYLLNTLKDRVQIVNLDRTDILSDIHGGEIRICWSSKPEQTQERIDSAQSIKCIGNAVGQQSVNSLLTRQSCIERAHEFFVFSWSCTSNNLTALTGWTKPHFISGPGSYVGMPYCWGGFNSKAEFNSGLSNGGRPGNINTSNGGILANTYGMDCSGFVSRAWFLFSKRSTQSLCYISTQVSWDNAGAADAINNVSNHVRLLIYKTATGNYVVYECTTRENYDRVVSATFTLASLQSGNYAPYHYDELID